MQPINFRNQPVGCTGTIMYQIYGEQKLEIEPKIAGLLCAAIISDTLMFRSPTCTLQDKMAAGALALIADISIEEFAREMFRAGSNLKDKSRRRFSIRITRSLSQREILLSEWDRSAPWTRKN